jgi:NurA-like 5'-3' nuclease
MKERRMTDAGIEKRLWLLEKETKALEKKIDALIKSTLELKADIKDFLSVQKTYMELVSTDESGK